MKLFVDVVIAILVVEFGVIGVLVLRFLFEKLIARHKNGRSDEVNETIEQPPHEHDCLVEECDFHTDAEVDGRLRKWLADNKLRGAVVTDQAVKEFMLNWIIADVREQRPLAGEDDADRGTLS